MTYWPKFKDDIAGTVDAIKQVHKFRMENYTRKENIEIDYLDPAIISAVKNVYNGNGYTFTGSTGVGKTKLIETMNVVLDSILDCKTFYLHSSKLKNALKNEDGYVHSGWHLAERLFIDDVGAEQSSYMEYGSEIRPFEEIINERYDNNIGPLFITTNLNISDFQKRYGDRVLSRVIEMSGKFITITGVNHRYEQAKTD